MKRISPLLILFAIALAFAACNNEYVRKQAMQVDLAKDSSTKDAEHLVVFGKPSFKADTIGFLEQGEVLKEYATGGEHNEWISVVLPDGKTGWAYSQCFTSFEIKVPVHGNLWSQKLLKAGQKLSAMFFEFREANIYDNGTTPSERNMWCILSVALCWLLFIVMRITGVHKWNYFVFVPLLFIEYRFFVANDPFSTTSPTEYLMLNILIIVGVFTTPVAHFMVTNWLLRKLSEGAKIDKPVAAEQPCESEDPAPEATTKPAEKKKKLWRKIHFAALHMWVSVLCGLLFYMCAGFILPLADAMVYLFLLVQAAALVYTLYVAFAHKKFWQIVLYWVLFIPALLIFYMQLYVSVLVVLALCVFATFLMKFTRKKGKKGKDDKAPEASEMPENEEKPAETAVSTDETSNKEENPQI